MIIKISSEEFSFSLPISAHSREEIFDFALSTVARLRRAEKKRLSVKYKIEFLNHGPNKIECIRVIRTQLNIGLKESKDASERGGHIIFETPDKTRAEIFLSELRRVGASAELRSA